MIKVNLLSDAKRAPARKSQTVRLEGVGASQNILMIVILGFAVAFAGWRYYSLGAEGDRLVQDLEVAREQLEKVQKDREAIEDLKRKKELFQKQIDIITELKNNQSVPVRLLDEVSRNLPDFLWLMSMQESGNELTFSGRATTPNAYANFYNNLSESPYFDNVGRISYTALTDDVTFSLGARFVPAGAPKRPRVESQQGQ